MKQFIILQIDTVVAKIRTNAKDKEEAYNNWYSMKNVDVIYEDKRTDRQIEIEEKSCEHKQTVALNEEGNAGVYCVSCGEKLTDEC